MDVLAVLQLVSTLLVLVAFSCWSVHVRAERERAERELAELRDQQRRLSERAERERAELRDEQLRLGEGQRRLSARVGRIITVEALQNAQRCVFALSLGDRRDWRVDGVGVVCVSEGNAVTAAHNLTAAKATPGARVYGEVYADGAATRLQLEVIRVNKQLDVATLRVVTPSAYPHFLECCKSLPADVPGGTTLALCAFQTAIQEHAPEFGCRMGVMPATAVRVSPHERHLLYACATYAGDSGGALLMHDGQLVGIHLEFVNVLRENLARKVDMTERLTDVEESLDELMTGAGQGTCVALLATPANLGAAAAGVPTGATVQPRRERRRE